MSQATLDASPLKSAKPTRGADDRPDIPLPNGKVAVPRKRWARGKRISDKTASKLKGLTFYIANVAYVTEPDATLKLIEHGKHVRRGGRR